MTPPPAGDTSRPRRSASAAEGPDALRVEWFRGREGLEELRESWRRLNDDAGSRRWFHRHEWYRSYLHSLCADDRSHYFATISRAGALRAIMPLQHRWATLCGVPLRLLQAPDHAHVPLSDLILAHDAQKEGLLGPAVRRQLATTGPPSDAIIFEHALEDSNIRLLLEGVPRSIVVLRRRCDELPTLDYDSHLARFSKNFRANLRKARNKLAETPRVEFVQVRRPEHLGDALRCFLDTEASGWKGAGDAPSAIKSSHQLACFYEQLAKEFGAIGACEINLLTVDDLAIAAQFSLVIDDTCYVLKIGYQESHARLAPGNMLLERLLQTYANHPRIKHVNLVTDAQWHKDWKPSTLDVFGCYHFFATPRGLAAFAAMKGKEMIAPVYRRRVRPWLAGRSG